MKELEKTTQTWKRKPQFLRTVKQYSFIVSTTSDVYIWLNDGTRTRYAVMTPDFVSKTKPRWIGSRLGQGGLSHFNFRNPRSGIQARAWTDTIKLDYKPSKKMLLYAREELKGVDIFT